MADNLEIGSVSESFSTSEAAQQIESLLSDDNPEMDEISDGEEPEEHDEVDSEESEEETEEESESEEELEEPEEETEEQPIESLADLAEALEMSEEDVLANFKAKVIVDGEEADVTLAELRNGYQKDSDYRRKTMELADQRKAFEGELTQVRDDIQKQHLQLGKLFQEVESLMMGDVSSQEMFELRATDPAEYSARMLDLQRKQTQLNQLRQQAANDWGTNQQRLQEKQFQQIEQWRNKEMERLRAEIPQWNKALQENVISHVAEKYGYQPEELQALTVPIDSRLIKLAFDSMQAKETASKVDVVKKKVKRLPKLQKPGKQVSKKTVHRGQVEKLRSRAKKTGDVRDAAKAIESLL